MSIYYYNSDKHKKSFFVIPKNATTSIKLIFGCGRDEKPKYEVFTILRDPSTRAYSAYHETLRRRTYKGTFLEFLQYIEAMGHFDEHTIPQSMYFNDSGLRIKETKFFRFEEMKEVGKYLGVKMPHENMTVDIYEDHWLGTKEMELIKRIYKKDFQLIKTIWN